MTNLALVMLGGSLGAGARHLVNSMVTRLAGAAFPWGTFSINIAGSFAMGLLAGWLAFRSGGGPHLRLFLATGVLGGFTTFSAFSLEAVLLWERGALGAAAGYVAGSVGLSIVGLAAGLAIMRALG